MLLDTCCFHDLLDHYWSWPLLESGNKMFLRCSYDPPHHSLIQQGYYYITWAVLTWSGTDKRPALYPMQIWGCLWLGSGEMEIIPLTLSCSSLSHDYSDLSYLNEWYKSEQPETTPGCPGTGLVSIIRARPLRHLLRPAYPQSAHLRCCGMPSAYPKHLHPALSMPSNRYAWGGWLMSLGLPPHLKRRCKCAF